MEFTKSERSTIVNALRAAAERYREDVSISREFGFLLLAQQFEHQAFEVGELAGRIEEMEN